MGRRKRRLEEVERELPPRLKREPKIADKPSRRPYPQHEKDLIVLDDLLEEIGADLTNQTTDHFALRDDRIPMLPYGVLFFHVLDIQDLDLSKKNLVPDSPFCVYVELECQDNVKCSDPVLATQRKKIPIDHSVHMPLELTEVRSDDNNDFLVHVYVFQDPEVHYLVGSQVVHVYEFVRELHGISYLKVVSDLSFYSAKLTYEFAWTYGTFGYGYSNQFWNPKNPPFESISHSLFPRIALSPEDFSDNKVNARIPKKLRLITLHSLLVRTPQDLLTNVEKIAQQAVKKLRGVNVSDDYEAKAVVFRRVKFHRGTPSHVSLNLDIHQKFMEDDFNQSYGEYICLRNRKDRLAWLGGLVDGRIRDRMEYDESSEMFKDFDDVEDARRVLSTRRPLACPPGFLEHNVIRKTPCKPFTVPEVAIRKEDLWGGDTQQEMTFMKEKLHAAPRFGGYLSIMFGFDKPPEGAPAVDPEVEAAWRNGGVDGGHHKRKNKSCCKRLCGSICSIVYYIGLFFHHVMEFLFPTLEHATRDELPEISVTLPSPQHSTTDFRAFCSQRQVYLPETDFEASKRRAKKYLLMTRGGMKMFREQSDGDDGGVWEDLKEDEYTVRTRPFLGEGNAEGKRMKDSKVVGETSK